MVAGKKAIQEMSARWTMWVLRDLKPWVISVFLACIWGEGVWSLAAKTGPPKAAGKPAPVTKPARKRVDPSRIRGSKDQELLVLAASDPAPRVRQGAL